MKKVCKKSSRRFAAAKRIGGNGFQSDVCTRGDVITERFAKKLRRVDSLRGVRVRGRARSEIRLVEINGPLNVCAQVAIVMTPSRLFVSIDVDGYLR